MTLPNMPIRVGDPGVFACKITDGGPAPAATPDPGPAAVMAGVWLVLTLCQHCNARTGRYCHLHNGVRPSLTPAERKAQNRWTR